MSRTPPSLDLTQGYYDISPLISARTAVFPGDVPFGRTVSLDFKKRDNLVLSSLQTTVHLGAHTDAPGHYHPDGKGIDQQELSPYLGKCQVLRVKATRGTRISMQDLGFRKIEAERVLFCTGSYPDPDCWNGDFNSLSPELVDHLARNGVKLVGIDTPSVDPAEDKELHAHSAIWRNKLAILEGIVLDSVPEGIYTLIALPLKLKDADASPVRAILVKGA